MIKNKVITIIVLMIKVFSKTSVVIRLSPTIIKTTYQVFIVNLMMLFDRLSHKKTLVFYVEELGFLQFIFPIIAILKDHRNISLYLAADNKNLLKEHLKKQLMFAKLKYKIFSLDLCRDLSLVDVFISPSIFGKGPHNAYNIHVAHNLPLLMKMESYPRNLLLNYNVQFFSGPLQRAQYDHMFKKNQIASASIRLCDIGYPKLDALLQGEYKRLDVLHELGLDAKKPTVLYAPAWDPGASLRSFGEAVIEKLTSLDGVNVIVKLHPVTYTLKKNPNFDFYTGGVDWVERLSRFEKYPNFRHVVDYKIDPLLAASDVMVTDISSVALEFILLDKPVIYLDCPEYFEKTIKQFGWNNDPNYILNNPDAKAMRNAGLCISDLSELVNAVQECIDHPEKKSEKRTAFSRRILYNPGRGAETAAKTVLELLRLE